MVFNAIKQGLIKGFRTALMLLRIMIPIYFGVTLLKHTDFFMWLAGHIEPAMRIFGLPGEAVAPLVASVFADEYSVVAAMNGFTFSIAECTVIAMMTLCFHSIPVETVMARKIGMPALRFVLFRIGMAVVTGILVAALASVFLGGHPPGFAAGDAGTALVNSGASYASDGDVGTALVNTGASYMPAGDAGTALVNSGASYASDGDAGTTLVNTGASYVPAGAAHVTAGAAHVTDGAAHVTAGVADVTDGAAHVTDGAAHVTDGAASMPAGAASMSYASGVFDEGWGAILTEMGWGALRTVLTLLRVLIPLMVGIELLLEYRVIEGMAKRLGWLCRLMGIGRETILPLLIGLFLGVTYGAGAIAEMNRTRPLPPRDMTLLGVFIFSCHGIIETTYLFTVAGASFFFVSVVRLAIAVGVTIAARLLLPRNM